MTFFRVFFSAIFGIAVCIAITRRDNPAWRDESWTMDRTYGSIIDPTLLPCCLIALILMACFLAEKEYVSETLLSFLLGIFADICVYYVLLLLLLPLLRKWLSARTVAFLWIVPNILYITAQSAFKVDHPLLVLRLPAETDGIIFAVWAAGFAAVMIVGMVRHVRFRRLLLSDVRPADAVTEMQWKKIQTASGSVLKKAPVRVVISENTVTPLTVGLFRRRMVLVLPDREYAPEELELVMRHELIHVLRCDSGTKFFLLFCKAACWFNPLMGPAMRRCSEDLELSCDESVLEQSDAAERHRYAELILSAAGDERGFSTCLSADARALGYRLRGIVEPKKKPVGGIVVGLTAIALLLCSNLVAFTYGEYKAADEFFGGDAESVVLERETVFQYNGSGYSRTYFAQAPDELLKYIGSLTVSHLAASYEFESENELHVFCSFTGTQKHFAIDLRDGAVFFVPFYETRNNRHAYYLAQPVDWDYVMSLLEPVTEEVFY